MKWNYGTFFYLGVITSINIAVTGLWRTPNLDHSSYFKVCFLGDGGVGKTTLIQRFLSGKFIENLQMTIGVQFHIHKRTHEGQPITFQIWDLGGQERFRRMRVFEQYVQGAHAIILAVDLSQFHTFINLPNWLDIAKKAKSQPVLVLIGTKKDLKREVREDLLEEWAKARGVQYVTETSALTGEAIEELFNYLTVKLLAKREVVPYPKERDHYPVQLPYESAYGLQKDCKEV